MLNPIVSTYANYEGREHTGDVTLSEVLDRIRTGDPKVTELRRLLSEGHDKRGPLCEPLKRSIPAFAPNALLSPGQKSNSRVIRPTGLVYVDLDDHGCAGDAEKLMARPECVAAFRSVSGEGYGCLMAIEGLTVDNFSDLQRAYIEIIGVCVDRNALGLSRGCVVSHDPDIYVNPDPVPFALPEKVCFSAPPVKNEGASASDVHSCDRTPRFQTQLDDSEYGDDDFKVIPEGRTFLRGHLMGVREGNRNSRMRTLCAVIVHNNPKITLEALRSWMFRANAQWLSRTCRPLPVKEIASMCAWTHARHLEGKLTHHKARQKKVWFKDGCGLTPTEKRKVAGREIAKLKVDAAKEKIYKAIEELQSGTTKITQDTVSKLTGMNLRTVKRYWPEFKEYVKGLNDEKVTSGALIGREEGINTPNVTFSPRPAELVEPAGPAQPDVDALAVAVAPPVGVALDGDDGTVLGD